MTMKQEVHSALASVALASTFLLFAATLLHGVDFEASEAGLDNPKRKVDLDVDANYDNEISIPAPDDPIEESAGGIVVVGESDDIKIRLVPDSEVVTNKLVWESDKIKVFEAETEVTSPYICLPPKTLSVRGEIASDRPRDVSMTLTSIPPGGVDAITYTVINVDLESVDFTSDHDLLNKNPSEPEVSVWAESNVRFESPEWVSSPSRNNPISQTKDSSVTVTVQIKIEPSGLPFSLIGRSESPFLSFEKEGETSSGSLQSVNLESNEKLPDWVGVLSDSIDWSIKVMGTGTGFDIATSGDHKIYVTYGTPEGSAVTERRVQTVCSRSSGTGTKKWHADKMFDWTRKVYSLDGATWGPEDIWLLYLDSEQAHCPGIAKFFQKHLEMLGLGSGEIVLCTATADGYYIERESPGFPGARVLAGTIGHPRPTSHDDHIPWEELGFLDGADEYNQFEATLKFEGYHYALSFSRNKTTAKDLLNVVFPRGPKWFYKGGTPPALNAVLCTDPPPWLEAAP